MFTEDFLMRLIQQLGRALQQALLRRQEDDPRALLATADAALRDALGIGTTLLVALPLDAALAELQRDLDPSDLPPLVTTLCALLLAEAAALDALGHGEEAQRRRVRAHALAQRVGVAMEEVEALLNPRPGE